MDPTGGGKGVTVSSGTAQPAPYPVLRRVLGGLGPDWRAEGRPVLDQLLAGLGQDDRDRLADDLDALFRVARTEFDHVEVLNASRTHYTPYGEFRSAEEFLRRLRERLGPPATGDRDRQAPGAPARDGHARLRGLLRALGPGWAAELGEVDPVRYLGQELRDLVDLERLPVPALVAELDALLAGGRSEAELAGYLSAAGVRQGVVPDAGAFLRALRDEAHEVATAYVPVAADPEWVAMHTVDDLRDGEFARAMTGLVRCHGVPAIRGGLPDGFADEVGELLDHVLPPMVAAYLDETVHAAQHTVDEPGLRRACWMRSAVEVLRTEYGGRDAAAFVDPVQLGAVDGVLRDRIRRHPSYAAGVPVDLPAAHWWWAGRPVAGPAVATGWHAGAGVWQASVTTAESGARAARRLVDRVVRAASDGLGGLFEVRDARAEIDVLGHRGGVAWTGPAVAVSLNGDRLVVPKVIPGAPPGERLVTSVTAHGVLSGGVPARWAVELVRDGETGAPTGSAVATLVLDAEPPASRAAAFESALRGWEDGLGVPLGEWRSTTRPTSIGRYGWGRETFAYDPPRAHPLLNGVSAHLWDGELGPALIGLARGYAVDVVGDVDRRPWEEDWVAALAYLGAQRWDRYLADLVAATRQLTVQRWYELCLARSGVQFVAEELADARIADIVDAARIAALDDAMRTYGHRFGPVPLDDVPGRLHRVHRWWRYPSGTPDGSRAPGLGELAAELAKEAGRTERQRPTGAATSSITAIATAVDQVLSGELPGCDGASAARFCDDVAGSWAGSADLTKHVLGFFRPIAHHARLWRTPAAATAAPAPAAPAPRSE